MDVWHLLIYAIVWLSVILAAILFFVAKKHSSVNIQLLLLYILLIAMLGPIGEIFVGTFYNSVFGHPLWLYRVLPTHEGYTSFYAPVIWGIAGAGLYFAHEILSLFKTKRRFIRALIIMFETILFESLLNTSFLLFTGGYLFYYTPGDLFHITSLQTLPFYFFFGFVITDFIKQFKKDPLLSAAMFALIMFVVVFLTN